jgi:ATP-dependent Clp protease ATP-binding subunit ClpC
MRLNRLKQEVSMVFSSPEQEEIFKRLDISLNDLHRRLATINFFLVVSEEVKKFVAEKGGSNLNIEVSRYFLNRAFERYLEDPLVEFILNDQPQEGALLEAVLTDEKDNLRIVLAKEVNTDVKE